MQIGGNSEYDQQLDALKHEAYRIVQGYYTLIFQGIPRHWDDESERRRLDVESRSLLSQLLEKSSQTKDPKAKKYVDMLYFKYRNQFHSLKASLYLIR